MTAMDIAPTFLSLASGDGYVPGDTLPMLGESILPFMRGEKKRVHDDQYVTTAFHAGRAFVRQGKWKLTQDVKPFDEKGFALYDLDADPGETEDLREIEVQKYTEMKNLWRTQRRELGIVLPEDL